MGDAPNWVSIESWKTFGMSQPVMGTVPETVPLDGTSITSRDVNVATLDVSEGGVEKTIKAAVGFGHGVANLKCGDCYIVKTTGTNLPRDQRSSAVLLHSACRPHRPHHDTRLPARGLRSSDG